MNSIEDVPALLLNSRAAAKALAISERSLWGLTKEGEIPCIRIGRSVRYALADLREWIEARKAANGDTKRPALDA